MTPDEVAFNVSLLVLRAVVGVVFLAHGINHVFRGGKIPGTARWFESLGMKPGTLHAWLASLTEIGSGALLITGLFTPLAGAGVVGVMVVAWITNHLKNGFFIFRPGEGYEYVMTLTVLGLAIAGLGAGAWSIDHAAGIFEHPSMGGLLIGLFAGGGGAAALLAVSGDRRPDHRIDGWPQASTTTLTAVAEHEIVPGGAQPAHQARAERPLASPARGQGNSRLTASLRPGASPRGTA